MSVAGLSTASLRSEESTQALKDSRRRTAKTAEKSTRRIVSETFLIFVCSGARGSCLRAFEAEKRNDVGRVVNVPVSGLSKLAAGRDSVTQVL